MCTKDDDQARTGFADLGALADYITVNNYFGPKERPKWETHERIEQPEPGGDA